jgi:hypothetical protein
MELVSRVVVCGSMDGSVVAPTAGDAMELKRHYAENVQLVFQPRVGLFVCGRDSVNVLL